MAIRDVIGAQNVVTIELASSFFRLSNGGFLTGLMNRELADEMHAVVSVIEDFVREENERELRLSESAGNSQYTLNVGLPFTNEVPTITVLGVSPGSFSFQSGSRYLKIEWLLAVSLGAMGAVAKYPDFKDGVSEIYRDLEAGHKFIETRLKEHIEFVDREIPSDIKGRRKPETLEDSLKTRLLSAPSRGTEI
ncbi:MAG: hypothetical protein ABJN39_15035 [Sulfitobacter sp.]|uniref:hypothetical protein n=1 Tax=unclassified Sulfitobacter TaxID=196795 RepID=UPI00294210AD|nr:hypothetical protein [Sulfitobacter sp. LC.270.F.C4]WOI15611.1 hypothetical protein R1T45_04270 [Sulfitobacter sp. LC.270.F.C4]